MALWFSNSAKSPPMIPLGNGKFLLWEEGAAIYSFRGGYSAPHLFSMLPDFKGVYHEIDTARIADSSALFHRLYYSEEMIGITTRSVCDLQITDSAVQTSRSSSAVWTESPSWSFVCPFPPMFGRCIIPPTVSVNCGQMRSF